MSALAAPATAALAAATTPAAVAAPARPWTDRAVEAGALVLLVFTPFAFGTVEPWSEAVAIVVVLAMTLAWVIGMVRQWEVRVDLPPGWLPAALFLALVALQIVPLPGWLLGALSPFAREAGAATISVFPYATWRGGMKVLAVGLFFLVLFNTVRTREQADRLVWTIVIVTAAISLIGLAQRVTWTGRLLWIGPEAPGNALYTFGPFVNRVHFVGLVIVAVPLALALYLRRTEVKAPPRERDRGYADRSLAGRIRAWNSTESGPIRLVPMLVLLMGGAALVSGTRGGLISLLAALLCMALLSLRGQAGRRRAAQLGLATALVVLAGVWIGSDMLARTTERLAEELGRPEESIRLQLWANVLDLWQSAPAFGTGFASFAAAFPTARDLKLAGTFSHAESDWIGLLVETGAVGLGLALLATAKLGVALWKRLRLHSSREVRAFALAAFAALMGMALHGVANFNLAVMAGFFYLAAAAVVGLRRTA